MSKPVVRRIERSVERGMMAFEELECVLESLSLATDFRDSSHTREVRAG